MQAKSPRKWHYDLLRTFHFLRHGWNKLTNHALDLKDAFKEFHEEVWREAADELSVDLEQFPGGYYRIRYGEQTTWIHDYQVQFDDFVALDVARNKPLVSALLIDHGIRVAPFLAFSLDEMEAARKFLNDRQSVCVVKPALGCAGGKGVTMHVTTSRELTRAALFASAFSTSIMIEEQIHGDVYRLLYLDGELLDAIHRRPPHVTGDGRSTIRELIRAENKQRAAESGKTALKVLAIDVDCRTTLKRGGKSLKYVPAENETVAVKSTTNESAARDCDSIRNGIHDEIVRECAEATRVLGFRLVGVDLMTPDASVPMAQSGGAIIEVNVSPGLHYHYQVRNVEERVPVAIPILRKLLHMQAEKAPVGHPSQ